MKMAVKGFGIAVLAVMFAFVLAGCKEPEDETPPPVVTPAPSGGGLPPSSGGINVINKVDIIVIAPVKGEKPSTTATIEDNDSFTIGSVSWSPDDNLFKGGEKYTVDVTLTAKSGYTFRPSTSATINGQNVMLSGDFLVRETTAVTLSHTFPATDTKIVTDISIKSQPTKLTYTDRDMLDLTGLLVTLTHDDNTTEDIYYFDFYRKNVTASPSAYGWLVYQAHNGQPVKIIYGSLTCSTDILTINIPVFTSVADLGKYLAGKDSSRGNPYIVKLNVSSLSGINTVLDMHYVSIDFTDSTFTSIEDRAFYNEYPTFCRLTSITIPNSVTSIGDYAFYRCPLTNITIPDSVTSIGDYAFYQCPLTNITIPDSVTSIKNTFQNCTSLTSVTIPDSVTSIGDYAFRGCTSLTRVTIPDSVTSIGSRAFDGCSNLDGVTIPDRVTSIGDEAFRGCTDLTYIAIGKNVSSIGSRAFDGCTNLTRIGIGTDKVALSSSRNWGTIFPYSKRVGFGANITSISDYAFYNSKSLTEVVMSINITSIGNYAFYGCTGIVDSASSVSGLIIPDSVKSIGNYAFSDCDNIHFKILIIPDSVTSIGSYAFANCRYLTSVIFANGSNIPNASFGTSAFPEGNDGIGGNTLKTAYSTGKAGTYTRDGDIWTKR